MAARKAKRPAFTLVEMLTVVVIITILVAILLPALNQARIAAKTSASRAGLHTIEVGLEMFRNDPGNNQQYPPSHLPSPWQPRVPSRYTGANGLADALVGNDLLGWDPLALTEPAAAWSRGGRGVTPRKGPYIEVDSIKHMPDAAAGAEVRSHWPGMLPPQASRVLLDPSFGDADPDAETGQVTLNGVFLYYRANPAAQSTWALNPFAQVIPGQNGQVIYDFSDNDLMIGAVHGTNQGLGEQAFFELIKRDSTSPIQRPYKAQSYLLISPGNDGRYGTIDDITNFGS